LRPLERFKEKSKTMLIAFDFDNTIVSYDSLFHKVAKEQGVIPHDLAVNKLAVRDHLRATERENIWTEMQGYVYGARMNEAEAYADVIKVMQNLQSENHRLAIISHKTKHPYLGKKYDLHAAARTWIEKYLQIDNRPLIASDHIFFELTKEEKLARIASLNCDIFIDDLPEILLAASFPEKTRRFLFDPEQHHHAIANLQSFAAWSSFESYLS